MDTLRIFGSITGGSSGAGKETNEKLKIAGIVILVWISGGFLLVKLLGNLLPAPKDGLSGNLEDRRG